MSALTKIFVNQKDPNSPLDIVPVAGRIGAEVRGVRLDASLDDETLQAIRAALLRHKVIFFRGQDHLDNAGQEAFASRLGKIVAHPTVPVADGSTALLELDSTEGYAASNWHTDVTFVDAYPAISVLRAITVPAAGGDTLWANAETAYQDLPDELRTLVDTLWAVHTNLYDYATVVGNWREGQTAYRNVFASTIYETEHPVVRVHPETGERSLLLGHFVKNFVGFNQLDSARLLNILHDHLTKPENTVRWRWQPGDVAIWDNRATLHRAIADFGTQRRTLRRATIEGDVPVGIDGRRSRIIRKERPAPVEQAA